MSKKKTQTKRAAFTLEPDGFSIHTFELSRRIAHREYRSMKDKLYRQQEQSAKRGWLYGDGYGSHICTLYAESGIRSIILEHNQTADTCFVRIAVNPRKLLEPECSYIGILPPEKSSVKMLKTEELERLIKQSVFKKESKDVMLQLAARLQRVQSVDKAIEKLEKDGYDTSRVLDRFDKLGVSPIPLWKNFCARGLPGPVELLRSVSGGEITVDYLKVKYK